MNDHIAKPIDVATMFLTMARWIRVAQASDEDGTVLQRPTLDTAARSVASATHAQEVPTHLPGIDTGRGLKLLQGNEQLYLRLLKKFASKQGDFQQRFSAAQSRGDDASAMREVHTLKGLAANIGATDLQESARRLEAACSDGAQSPDIDALLEQLVGDLTLVLGGLQELLEPAEVVDASRSDTGSALGGTELAQLCALLEDDDSEALDTVEALLRLDLDAPTRRMLLAVGESLAVYDFDEALQAVIGFVQSSADA